MELINLTRSLRPFRHIFVTGPQRSWTRFISKAIAYDLGIPHVDETVFNIDNANALNRILGTMEFAVIHCPGLCYCIENIAGKDDAVVMIFRPVEEIIASQERINWAEEKSELRKYGEIQGPISTVKYAHWATRQKRLIANPFEFNYHDFKDHRLFVPKPQRTNFKWNQTQP